VARAKRSDEDIEEDAYKDGLKHGRTEGIGMCAMLLDKKAAAAFTASKDNDAFLFRSLAQELRKLSEGGAGK
jgi:hypothetical protein